MATLAVEQLAQHIAFAVIAASATFGAVRVVTSNNVVHAALYLVVTLASVGASFLLLGAEFTGITQVLVYIGAIVVLFLFGIMLTRAPIGAHVQLTGRSWIAAASVAAGVLAVLSYALLDGFGRQHVDEHYPLVPQSTSAVADSIFRDYLVPFEVASVLLLAALIGAIVIARRD
jgi:NADH-quinone oxidoreductase subunit J